jgi:predicted enzyme related to lactoylglutathione lyase
MTRETREESRLHTHGKLSYVQIPALDVQQSAAFYANVFGWSVRDNAGHVSFDDAPGDLIGAWVTDRAPSGDAGVMPYISVDRVDDTLAAIAEHGGATVKEPYPEGGLWVATFRDPAGNVIGIWQRGPS